MVDANILFAASVWPRWPYEVIQSAIRGDFQLVVTPLILKQARLALARRRPEWTASLNQLIGQAAPEVVSDPTDDSVQEFAGLVRDPSDIPIALAAINARVDYLISEDKDLTVQDESTAELRSKVNVMLSGTFLREVMQWDSAALEQVHGRTWENLHPPAMPSP